ncbi:MAG: bifunctional indole-3-glycerol-phosphate synthase TrpC/phosphoribosylanthranilate isomerase TrpF, partial [Sphingomonadales bacterium]|nr:bifunctional indole-3-glycerol-phosphate synthase TrpC/phosphoribosylanthranilate isomerase TrpF [Sphingomonadales bacterium]
KGHHVSEAGSRGLRVMMSTSSPSVLDRIIAHKHTEVSERKKAVPLDVLKQGLVPSDRSLFEALSTKGPRFILECKRRSPSKGALRPDLKVEDIAALYAPFADAISVLTDTEFFGGSFDDLATMRKNVSQPVLCKDFMIDPYQVYEARFHGADAILLILSVLDDDTYKTLHAIADDLALDVLSEVHNVEERDRAVRLGAKIIGINNRNLGTFEESLDVTRTLAPAIPEDRIVVAESAIKDREDVLSLADVADAFLIGGAIMGAPRPTHKVRELVFGRVKVCGITRAADAKKAEELGATHVGCIFVPESPRCVSVEDAKTVFEATGRRRVGVFRDANIDDVAKIATDLKLDLVQLHGKENGVYRSALRAKLPSSVCVAQAVSVGREAPKTSLIGADSVLLDQGAGGTGKAFDWALLEGIEKRNLILAGGVGSQNIEDAFRHGVVFVDVNSTLEDAPGKKNHTKMEAFFTALREANLRQPRS